MDAEQVRAGVPGAGGSRCHHRECSSGGEVAQRSLRGGRSAGDGEALVPVLQRASVTLLFKFEFAFEFEMARLYGFDHDKT